MSLKAVVTDTIALFEERGVSKSLLKKEVKMRQRAPVGDDEFADALHDLKRRELIEERRDPFTDDTLYTITPRGQEWLDQ